jgi:hypothetical protein
MRVDGNHGATLGYEPNSYGEWQEQPAYREPPLQLEGAADHWNHREDTDYYSQPRALFRLMLRDRYGAVVESGGLPTSDGQSAWCGHLTGSLFRQILGPISGTTTAGEKRSTKMNKRRLLVTAVALSVSLGVAGSAWAAAQCPAGWKVKTDASDQWTCVPVLPALACPRGWNHISISKDVTVGSGLGQTTYHVCEIGCAKPPPTPK